MNHEEKTEITYEPVPGYRTVFHIALAAGIIYLGFIFIRSML